MLEKLSKYWKILEELTVMHLLIQTLFSSNDKTNKTRGSRPRITILSKITPAPDSWLHLGNIQFVAGWGGGGSDGWWWQLAVNYSEARRSAAGAYLLPDLRLSMAGAIMTVCNIIIWTFLQILPYSVFFLVRYDVAGLITFPQRRTVPV